MRTRIGIIMGTVFLVSFLFLGVFALPVGIPVGATIGILGELKYRDRWLLRASWVLLLIGIACLIYTLTLVRSM